MFFFAENSTYWFQADLSYEFTDWLRVVDDYFIWTQLATFLPRHRPRFNRDWKLVKKSSFKREVGIWMIDAEIMFLRWTGIHFLYLVRNNYIQLNKFNKLVKINHQRDTDGHD